jgi:ABC-2 type transport system permease protein
MNPTYVRMEILRTFRNRRFFIFSLVFPLVFFYLIAGANQSGTLGGISFAAYYLAGMTSFGTMAAMLANGGRIAGERSVGWNRDRPHPRRWHLHPRLRRGCLGPVRR